MKGRSSKADLARGPRLIFAALAVGSVVFTAALAITFAGQPPLDGHAFRQSQTALTAYWFVREGFRLAYETPVAGYPWSIPFEFPIYQAIVAVIAELLGASVTVVGRLVSFGFLLLCIPVVWSINRRLALPNTVFVAFVALLFSTPLYVYWGRAILIETIALFLALLAIKLFLDYLLGGRRLVPLILFSVVMTLCLLQKATTGLPVVLVLAVVAAIAELRAMWRARRFSAARWIAVPLLFLVPLAATYGWTQFTDGVKENNPLGRMLTSSALVQWNWGTLAQRFTFDFWADLILRRMLIVNLGVALGALIIAFSLARGDGRTRAIICGGLALGFLPVFLFPNLHIIHEYYQSSNQIFLLYAVAVGLGAVAIRIDGGWLAAKTLVAVLVLNGAVLFRSGYLVALAQQFDESNATLAISHVLRRELPPDGQFVAFGKDYSSTLAYLSERKSFTVPDWFTELEKVISHPGDYVEKGRLGAVLTCSTIARPDAPRLMAWASEQQGWKVGELQGCAIAVPGRQITAALEGGSCRAGIDTARVDTRDGHRLIIVSGWSATAGDPPAPPDGTFISLVPEAGGTPAFADTLRVPRPDMNRSLGMASDHDIGFSRLLEATLPPGRYTLGIVQQLGGRFIACPDRASLDVPG